MELDVTRILHQWTEGDEDALDKVFPFFYERLKHLAHARLRYERRGHTLNTTGLVHEAYLQLTEVNNLEWKDRNHFLAMASRVMRRVLVDHARRRKAVKRGGGASALPLEEERLTPNEPLIPDDHIDRVIEIDEGLSSLQKDHPRAAKAVELHYFGGLNLSETGAILGVSPPTVMRYLRFAEAWLARRWQDDQSV